MARRLDMPRHPVGHEMGFVAMAEPVAVDAEGTREEEEEEEEEEERVVYYDLDDTARRALLPEAQLKRDARAAAASRAPKQRVLERPTELFASHAALGAGGALAVGGEDDDDDDDDDDDASNPFAALLRAHSKPTPRNTSLASPPTRAAVQQSPVAHVTPPSPARPSRPVPRAKRSLSPPQPPERRPVSKRTPPLARSATRSSVGATTTQPPLAPTFEAADARPARWARTAPATKRRQSASSTAALAKQQAETKRRKSMPGSVSSLDEPRRPDGLTGGRRLSDVLSKATLLSQDRTSNSSSSAADQSFEYREPAREVDDGIADTAKEMQAEPFQTQFFSPSKLRNGSSSSHRKPRADAVLTKIRGSLGDAIRKAARKNIRDLTLLRSQGRTLLARADQDSAGEVHGRDFVVVRLDRLGVHPHLVIYDGLIEDLRVSQDLEDDNRGVVPTEGMKLTIVFTASDAAQQLACGAPVKIFAPFQIINESFVPGIRRRRRKFLMGTSLFEVVGSNP